jgi:hypothetical protein
MLRKLLVLVTAGLFLAMPAVADSTGPIQGYDGAGWFEDVKSPLLGESDWWGTTWGMHVTFAFTNYAGLLFDLQYDSHELSQINVFPAGNHMGIQGAGPGMYSMLEFPGSQTEWQTVFPLAAWVSGATQTGMTVSSSGLYPVFGVSFHAKNTDPANNSDIDISASVWQILHIVDSGTYPISPSDYFYKTEMGYEWELQPGAGYWFHNPVTGSTFIPASAFVATNAWINNVAGFGIEHIPEPAALGLVAAGVAAFVLARRRR